jgi:hypothetical protein
VNSNVGNITVNATPKKIVFVTAKREKMGVAKATDIDRSVSLFADGLVPVLSSDVSPNDHF